jgi:hypothetical protein
LRENEPGVAENSSPALEIWFEAGSKPI